MQDAYHNEPSKYDLTVAMKLPPVAQWLEHLISVWKGLGLIPFGDSDFFFAHAHDNLILNLPYFITGLLKFTIVLSLSEHTRYF